MPTSRSRGSRSSRTTTRRGGSQLGPTGLLIIGVVIVAWLLDQQFGWGLFPDQDPTSTPRPGQTVTATTAPGGTRVATTGGTRVTTTGGAAPAGLPAGAEAATVVRVADGDTITVELDGAQYGVRMIGIDTPESYTTRTGYRECLGKAAGDYMKALLPAGTTVYLEMDVTDEDRYDRLLRYVWADAGAIGTGPPGQAVMVNELMVREGFAIPYPYEPDVREQPRFQAAAAEAETEDTGIWCACGGERVPEDQTVQGCAIPTAPAAVVEGDWAA